jgi:hypothetical protein
MKMDRRTAKQVIFMQISRTMKLLEAADLSSMRNLEARYHLGLLLETCVLMGWDQQAQAIRTWVKLNMPLTQRRHDVNHIINKETSHVAEERQRT